MRINALKQGRQKMILLFIDCLRLPCLVPQVVTFISSRNNLFQELVAFERAVAVGEGRPQEFRQPRPLQASLRCTFFLHHYRRLGLNLCGVVCDSLAVGQNTDRPCWYLVSRSFKGHIHILVIMAVADEAGRRTIVQGVLCRLH